MKMKILWDVGFVLPEAAHLINGNKVAFGGWVGAMVKQLSEIPYIELGVAMKAPVTKLISKKIGRVQYYLLPENKRDKFDIYKVDCDSVLKDFQPDLLQIEGTELSHARTFLRCFQGKNIVSLQGIINGHEPHQFGGLPVGEMLCSFHPIKMLVAAAMIANKQFYFKPRLSGEIETIKRAQNILGRTTWDRAHAYAINPVAPYFPCNRILRDVFYQKNWNVEQMQRHTLFVGNSLSALKGAHYVLHAVAQLKEEYPDLKLYIAGENVYPSSWRQWKKRVGYPAYLRYLIDKLNIKNHVKFTGMLQADAMAERLSSVNAYVLCSTIENSPNTMGEAMIMGVPVVSSFVGGAPDMASDGKETLFYRDNDPQLLAYQIKRVFDDDQLALRLSENARRRALITHDPQNNLNSLLAAYRTILGVEQGQTMRES